MKILLTINKKEVKVSPEEARELYDELHKLFAQPQITYVPSVLPYPPIWQEPGTLTITGSGIEGISYKDSLKRLERAFYGTGRTVQ